MANKVLNRVWEHSHARGAARCLMLALADVADERGVAYPGVDYLAEMIRESTDYTDVLIHKQIEAGELYKIAGRGRGHKTRFAILCGLSPEKQAALKGVLQNPFSGEKKGHDKTPFGDTGKGVQNGEKRGTFSDAKEPRPNGSESEQTPIVKKPDPMIQDHDPPPPEQKTLQQGGGGGGEYDRDIATLFRDYHIGQYRKLAKRYYAEYPNVTIDQLRLACESRFDRTIPATLAGGRLYLALQDGLPTDIPRSAPTALPEPTRVPMPADVLDPREAAARILKLKAEYDRKKREAAHAPS